MEFKDLPVPFQEMASNVVRSQLATLDLSTVEKETIDTISGNVRRAFIGLYEEKQLAKWHLNRSQFGIRIDHDLAFISDHSLASQSITIWHASDH